MSAKVRLNPSQIVLCRVERSSHILFCCAGKSDVDLRVGLAPGARSPILKPCSTSLSFRVTLLPIRP